MINVVLQYCSHFLGVIKLLCIREKNSVLWQQKYLGRKCSGILLVLLVHITYVCCRGLEADVLCYNSSVYTPRDENFDVLSFQSNLYI